MKLVKKNNFVDSRGIIRDIFVGSKFSITYISSKKGAVRGNHYHKKTMQYEYVLSGSFLYFWQKGERGSIKNRKIKKGDLVFINPMETHTFKALEKSEILSIKVYNHDAEKFSKDTFSAVKSLC